MAASSSSAFARNTSSRVLAAGVAAAFPSLPISDASTSSNSAYSETLAHSTEQSATMLNSGVGTMQVNEGHFAGGDVEDVARTVFGGGDGNTSTGNFRRLISTAATLPPEVKSLGTQLAKDPEIQRALIKHFHARLVGSPAKDDKTTAQDDDFGVREIPLSDAEDDEEFRSPTPIASSVESSAVLVEPEVLARDQQLLEQFRVRAMTTPTPPIRQSRIATPTIDQQLQPGEEGVPRASSSNGKNEVKENIPAVAPSAPSPLMRAASKNEKSPGLFVDFVNGVTKVAARVVKKFEQIFSGLESYVSSFYQSTSAEEQPGTEMHIISASPSDSSSSSSSSSLSTSSSSSNGMRDLLVSSLYFAGVVVGVLVLWKAVGGVMAVTAASTV